MHLLKKYILVTYFLYSISFVHSQVKKEFSESIEDNSFLIEEAYNQEERVVQHISNGIYQSMPAENISFSFTQEWPLFKYKHQLSYTILYMFINSNAINGFGDCMINYRYQLFYKDDWACVSPRFSVILPTGDSKKGLGNGVFGVQINIPASKRLSDHWVIHFNAGTTFLPGVKGVNHLNQEVKRNLISFNLGGSAIWLLNANFNILLEVLENFNNVFDNNGKVGYLNETIINPGFRAAINLGKLQVVPGLSLPVTITRGKNGIDAFFYLSFEHPF